MVELDNHAVKVLVAFTDGCALVICPLLVLSVLQEGAPCWLVGAAMVIVPVAIWGTGTMMQIPPTTSMMQSLGGGEGWKVCPWQGKTIPSDRSIAGVGRGSNFVELP